MQYDVKIWHDTKMADYLYVCYFAYAYGLSYSPVELQVNFAWLYSISLRHCPELFWVRSSLHRRGRRLRLWRDGT